MRTPLDDLIDKNAIAELIVQLSYAFDERDVAGMRAVFTPRVECDLGPMGVSGSPIVGTVDADQLSTDTIRMLATFDMTQHLNGMHHVVLNGDEATLTAYVIGSHFLAQRADAGPTERVEPWNTIGARYDMRATRTPSGWRFSAWKWRMMWTRDNHGVWDEVACRLGA